MNSMETEVSTWRERVPTVLGWYAFMAALWCLILAIFRGLHRESIAHFISWLIGLGGFYPSGKFSLVLLYIFFAYLCAVRKNIAIWIYLLVQSFNLVWQFFSIWFVNQIPVSFPLWHAYAVDLFEIVIFLCCAGIAFLARDSFKGKVILKRATISFTYLFVSQGLLYLVGYFIISYLSAFYATRLNVHHWLLKRLFGLPVEDFLPIWVYPVPSIRITTLLLSTVSALNVLIAIFLFFYGERLPARNREDDLHLRRLITQWGHLDSLSYYATSDARAQVFSPDGQAAITYAVACGVALSGGDPVGNPASWGKAIKAWQQLCYQMGYIPAVISASEAGASAYRKAGMKVHSFGDEAIIQTSKFDFRNPFFKPLIAASRRVKRAGVEIEIRRQATILPAEIMELTLAANNFRTGDERGFSMALDRIFAPEDDQQMVVVARDNNKDIQALLTFVPWGTRGLSLNLMRRSKTAPNGIIEAMVLQLIEVCCDQKIENISLNFAMFRQAFAESKAVDAYLIPHLKGKILRFLSRFWQLESLYESNARYAPEWKERFFCVSANPFTTLALTASGILEGFLPAPRILVPTCPIDYSIDQEYLTELAKMRKDLVVENLKYMPNEQTRIRMAKVAQLKLRQREPYPAGFDLGKNVKEIDLLQYAIGEDLKCHGRLVAKRNHGGVVFWDLFGEGKYLQIVLEQDGLSSTDWEDLPLLDLGDCIYVEGKVGRTRSGELSLIADKWKLVAKALRPGPHPKVALDVRTRTRKRTMALMNDETALFLLRSRSQIMASVRKTLAESGYIEVETPMLQAVQGGANARPFVTHANAYSTNVFMRIAPELYLKRLAIAGMEAIFEMGRSFRNEGADLTHNPEFTSLEAYKAGADYQIMRELTQKLIQQAAVAVHGKEVIWRPVTAATKDKPVVATIEGQDYYEYDISGQWPVKSVYEAVSEAVGTTVTTATTVNELLQLCRAHQIETTPGADHGALIGNLYDELVEENTEFPTFYQDFPVSSSPLTRQHRQDPALAERWDLVAFGMELGTAYTELTDPAEQRARFTEQSLAAAGGDPEAMSLDEDFLECLELGMLPTGGLGLGMDRVAMLVTGGNIRQVLAFPFVKPSA